MNFYHLFCLTLIGALLIAVKAEAEADVFTGNFTDPTPTTTRQPSTPQPSTITTTQRPSTTPLPINAVVKLTASTTTVVNGPITLECAISGIDFVSFGACYIQFYHSKLQQTASFYESAYYYIDRWQDVSVNSVSTVDYDMVLDSGQGNLRVFRAIVRPKSANAAGIYRCSVQKSVTVEYFSNSVSFDGIFPVGNKVTFSATINSAALQVGKPFYTECLVNFQMAPTAHRVRFYQNGIAYGEYYIAGFDSTPAWTTLGTIRGVSTLNDPSSIYPKSVTIVKPQNEVDAQGEYYCTVIVENARGTMIFESNRLNLRYNSLDLSQPIIPDVQISHSLTQTDPNNTKSNIESKCVVQVLPKNLNYQVSYLFDNVSLSEYSVKHYQTDQITWNQTAVNRMAGINIFPSRVPSVNQNFNAIIQSRLGFNRTRCGVQCSVTVQIPNVGNAVYYSDPYDSVECQVGKSLATRIPSLLSLGLIAFLLRLI